MATPIIAVMTVKKTTANKIVWTEVDDSPAGGMLESLYLPKYACTTILDNPTEITVLIEAGRVTATTP